MIRAEETGGPPFNLAVTQHGAQDPLLTRWARANFADQLKDWLEDSRLVTDPQALSDLLDLTGPGQWDALTPDPRELRAEIAGAAESAQERLLLAAPDLRSLPAWLDDTLIAARRTRRPSRPLPRANPSSCPPSRCGTSPRSRPRMLPRV